MSKYIIFVANNAPKKSSYIMAEYREITKEDFADTEIKTVWRKDDGGKYIEYKIKAMNAIFIEVVPVHSIPSHNDGLYSYDVGNLKIHEGLLNTGKWFIKIV